MIITFADPDTDEDGGTAHETSGAGGPGKVLKKILKIILTAAGVFVALVVLLIIIAAAASKKKKDR